MKTKFLNIQVIRTKQLLERSEEALGFHLYSKGGMSESLEDRSFVSHSRSPRDCPGEWFDRGHGERQLDD